MTVTSAAACSSFPSWFRCSAIFFFTALVILYRKRLAWQEIVFFLACIFSCRWAAERRNVPARRSRGQYRRVALALLFILVNIQFEHELLLKRQEKELDGAAHRHDAFPRSSRIFYNTLTTIRQLCDVDPQKAKTAIRDFFPVPRGNMDSLSKSKAPIPFEQELSRGTLFGTGTAAVSGKGFMWCMRLPHGIFSILPLTLQPIVENAVHHGVLKREEGGTVTVKTEETSDAYLVTVSDDGVGFRPDMRPRTMDEPILALRMSGEGFLHCAGVRSPCTARQAWGPLSSPRDSEEGGNAVNYIAVDDEPYALKDLEEELQRAAPKRGAPQLHPAWQGAGICQVKPSGRGVFRY